MTSYKALIPLDGSAFSRQVLPYACRLLDPEHYSLILLHVAPPPEDYTAPPPRPVVVGGGWLLHEAAVKQHPLNTSQVWEGYQSALLKEMEPELRRLQQAGFEASAVVRFGGPAQEIVDLVEEEDIVLVVMATHGRTGLSRMVMGSTAEKVLCSLRIPVMMVRPLREAAEEPLPIGFFKEDS
jgi:nucleotide-binding universal stress UspA family protein